MDYKSTLMWKEINETPRIFSEIKQVNELVMKDLVNDIKSSNAKNFVTAARGTSDHALVYFKYLLEIYSNYTVSLSAPSVVTLYHGKVNYANSVVIGCSQSGMAEDVLEVLKKANEDGAITIGITNNPDSPIAKMARYHLYCNAGEEKSVGATKTFNAQLYLLLWLASELAGLRNNIKILKNFDKEMIQVIPQIDAITDKYLEMFKGKKDIFILSRGLTYAVALETAIKIQELCYVNAKGFATSEFYHGPQAMVNKDTPIIIFCGKFTGDEELQTLIRADQMKCIERMLYLRAPVLLVTNDCILTGKFKPCNDALINISVPEELSMFAFSLFAQIFSCKLSCALGLNPDEPRSVSKITITK